MWSSQGIVRGHTEHLQVAPAQPQQIASADEGIKTMCVPLLSDCTAAKDTEPSTIKGPLAARA